MSGQRQEGFTLIETLVAIALFSVLAAGFYSVMLSQVGGSERTRSVARIAEEARLGFNRMVRDAREGSELAAEDGCAPSDMQDGECFNVKVDFDGDEAFDNPNPSGDYENLTFSYDAGEDAIEIVVCDDSGNCKEEVLIENVQPTAGSDIFTFSSNLLQYDTDGNGLTSWPELDTAAGDVGNGNGELDVGEWQYLSNVAFALEITGEDEDDVTRFFSEAQLRNKRFGE